MAKVTKTARKSTTKTATSARASSTPLSKTVKLPVPPHALLAELIATALLVSVAASGNNGLFVGLTFFVVFLVFSGASVAHANPAVTFGLWAVRKVETAKMLAYIVAQMLGGLLAFVLLQFFSRGDYQLSFASFGAFDGRIFLVELIGAMVLVLGVAAALDRAKEAWSRALSVGFTLIAAIALSTGLLSFAFQSVDTTGSSESRLTVVDNVTLNPAVALAMTERDASSNTLLGGGAAEGATPPSRLTLETAGGALAGGVLGGAFYVLLGTERRKKA